jgi:ankyrin repeat protein
MLAIGAALLVPQAATAQFSESYNFLKAVRDRDGDKVNEVISKPGNTTIDTRDLTTGETALHIVVKRRDETWLSVLLSRGARTDIRDKEGNTPLLIAATIGFPEGVQDLLGANARPDVTNSSGETALMRAVQNRDLASVRLLIEAGANPDLRDSLSGMSARDYAMRDGRSPAIMRLLDQAKPKPTKVMGPS